jgi:phospholipid/cholesterol/gamma-HCH transport system substrate-binding protein
MIITQGSSDTPIAEEGQQLASVEPVETDAIMASLQVTAGFAEIISKQVAEIMIKVNSGNGTLGRLIQDKSIAQNLDSTMLNLKNSSKGLNENMEAAKHNILLRGYYNKKARADVKKKKEVEDSTAKAQKALENKK